MFECDFERCAFVGGRCVEHLLQRHPQPIGDRAQQRQSRFAAPVLYQRQLACGNAHVGAKLFESEAGGGAKVAHPPTECGEICHICPIGNFGETFAHNLAPDARKPA